jgi:serine protease Do
VTPTNKSTPTPKVSFFKGAMDFAYAGNGKMWKNKMRELIFLLSHKITWRLDMQLPKTVILGAIILLLLGGVGLSNSSESFALKSTSSGPTGTLSIIELFKNLAEKANPGVVNIQSLKKVARFYGDFHWGMSGVPQMPLSEEYKLQGEGSGFIIEKDGLILTSAHVVARSDYIQVMLFDGTMHKGQLIGIDSLTDIALLKINAPTDLPVILLGNSKSLKTGEWVMAIGSPLGLEQTVTVGIVSAKDRFLGNNPYSGYIQIDATINPGNSGGPLINIHGEAIGINAAVTSQGQGLGFSIPIDIVKNLLPQLKKKGEITRSWLGVIIRNINLLAKESLNLNVNQGSLVVNILAGSPAEEAGIQQNDVIIEFDGHPIKSSHEFPYLISNTVANQKIPIKLVRGNTTLDLNVTLRIIPEEGLR